MHPKANFSKMKGSQHELTKALHDYLNGQISIKQLNDKEKELGTNYEKATLEMTGWISILRSVSSISMDKLVSSWKKLKKFGTDFR
jgi:hypothetical protein